MQNGVKQSSTSRESKEKRRHRAKPDSIIHTHPQTKTRIHRHTDTLTDKHTHTH